MVILSYGLVWFGLFAGLGFRGATFGCGEKGASSGLRGWILVIWLCLFPFFSFIFLPSGWLPSAAAASLAPALCFSVLAPGGFFWVVDIRLV